MWQTIRGDLRAILPYVPDNSVDACVTDPPYELGFMGKRWDATGIAFLVETWGHVLRVLKPGGHLLAFSGTRTYHRMVVAIEDAGFEIRDQADWLYGQGFPKSLDAAQAIDRELGLWSPRGSRVKHAVGQEHLATPKAVGPYAPRSWQATRWQGWGTAFCPSHEPICVARKPLEGTMGANLLRWGVGALNVDACRIGASKKVPSSTSSESPTIGWGTGAAGNPGKDPNVGRWPKNLLLDETAAAILEAQSGASRFFYVAKASKSEREGGLDYFPIRTPAQVTNRTEGSIGLANPRAGMTGSRGRRNHHPTVKPVALMRYLCRLVTPPGGLIVDPFMGSGTTLVAAIKEGFHILGIDLDSDEHGQPLGYTDIATARCRHAESL